MHASVHSSIRPSPQVENIMLDYRGHVKLIDFGLATEIKKENR